MKHCIPARTLRDWMKRLNIKSVFTHHSNNGNKERSGSQGMEEESLASSSPEPQTLPSPEQGGGGGLNSPSFGGLSHFIRGGFAVRQEDEIDDDEEGEQKRGGLRIDEGGAGGVASMAQIAQAAN